MKKLVSSFLRIAAKRRKGMALVHRNAMQGGTAFGCRHLPRLAERTYGTAALNLYISAPFGSFS